MATFDSIFPTFLAKCGELHDLLLSVAYALLITGIIVTVHHRFSHKILLHLLMRILVLTSLLVYLPVWGNTIQNLLQDSIISGLGVDPAQIYQQFLELLIIKRDPSTQSSWWNVLSQLHNITTDLIITAVLYLVGHFASWMMFWGYIFQKVILNMGYALSPLLIGFMAIPALKHTGSRYLLNLVGVLLWPLGWAVAALVTQGMLDFISNPTLEYIDPTSQLPDLQKTPRRGGHRFLDYVQHHRRARNDSKSNFFRRAGQRNVFARRTNRGPDGGVGRGRRGGGRSVWSPNWLVGFQKVFRLPVIRFFPQEIQDADAEFGKRDPAPLPDPKPSKKPRRKCQKLTKRPKKV